MRSVSFTAKGPRSRKQRLEFILSVIVLLVALASLISLVFYVNLTNAKYTSNLPKPTQLTEPQESILTPTKVIASKSTYHKETITIRGIVKPEAVVCQRQECPGNDSCCSCPLDRNIIIEDLSFNISDTIKEQLKLLGADLQPLCQRRPLTCQYNCSDWVKGAIYDVTGIFFAEPQQGLKVSLNTYLQVENKQLVKNPSVVDSLKNTIDSVQKMIQYFQSSGSYVIY